MSLLTKWWPSSKRGFATGFAHAFSGFGQVMSIFSVALAFKFFTGLGWGAAFIISPIFPLLFLVAYLIWARSSPDKIGLSDYVEPDKDYAKREIEMSELVKERGKWYPYKYMLSNKTFLVWIVIAFITGIARYGLVTWIPLYFFSVFNIGITDGLIGSLLLPVGMGVGTLVVPWMTDKWCKDNRLPSVILSAIVGAFAIGGFALLNPTVLWQMVCIQALLFVAGFCIYAINGTAWAYATDIGGRVFSGTSSGILNFSAYMGAAAQALVYGFLLTTIGWSGVFGSLAVFCVIMAILGFLGRKKKEEIS